MTAQPKPTAGDEYDAREYGDKTQDDFNHSRFPLRTDYGLSVMLQRAFLAGRQSSACKDLELLREAHRVLTKNCAICSMNAIVARIEARLNEEREG